MLRSPHWSQPTAPAGKAGQIYKPNSDLSCDRKGIFLLLTLLFLACGAGPKATLHAQEQAPKPSYTLEKSYEVASSTLLGKATDLLASKPEKPVIIDVIQADPVLCVLAILYVNRDREFVAVWDYSKSEILKVIPLNPKDGDVHSVKFLPNHEYLVIGQSEGISVIDTALWQLISTIRPPQGQPGDAPQFALFALSAIKDSVVTVIKQAPETCQGHPALVEQQRQDHRIT